MFHDFLYSTFGRSGIRLFRLGMSATYRPGRDAVQRVVMGMALTYVVSTQVLADQVRSGRFQTSAPAAVPTAV